MNYYIKQISYKEETKQACVELIKQKSNNRLIINIKLTNEELEKIRKHENPYVRAVSKILLDALCDKVPWPSWYQEERCEEERNKEIENIEKEAKEKINSRQCKIKEANATISYSRKSINELEILLHKNNKTLNRISNRHKKTPKLKDKKYELEQDILYELMRKQICETSLTDEANRITKIENEIKKIKEEKEKQIINANKKYIELISKIKPLPIELEEHIGFIPLSVLSGMEHKKVIGCYIIRNSENRKVYVGQSKDVIRRITKEHFQGTKVKNSIFAEDYYKAPPSKRSNLFEVKIIPCSTKDELDRVEAELINDNDSFRRGYNRTRGNE